MNRTLTAAGVSKRYPAQPHDIVALNQVSVTLEPGEFTVVLGPSGSGKTTLLSVLSGLTPPTTGQVDALGTDLWALGPAAIEQFRLRNCGFVFQGFNLLPALTATEQVQIVLEHAGVASAEARTRAIAQLEAVGLADRLDLRPAQLSGGEKQRVAIARALCKHPGLIFADEPTSALDHENGRRLAELLREAARQHGAIILCVTHDPRLQGHADRIIGMEDGRIISDSRVSNRRDASGNNGLPL